jgi:glutamate/aspartate transport system ATP-binding protein
MISEVLDVMVDLAREGMTMMVVTHEMDFVAHHSIRLAYQGRPPGSAGEAAEV